MTQKSQLPGGLIALAIVAGLVRLLPLGMTALLALYGLASQGGGVAEYEQVDGRVVLGLAFVVVVGLVLLTWQTVAAVSNRRRGLIGAAGAIAFADVVVFVGLVGFAAESPPAILIAVFVVFAVQLVVAGWAVAVVSGEAERV